MAFFRPKRSVPTPLPTISHASTNPMFESSSQRFASVRSVLAWTISTLAIGGSIGVWVFGPYFRLTEVTVNGTVVVQPESVERWVRHELDRPKWLIIPQNHSILLSSTGIAKKLHHAINTRLSVETVTATVTDRHHLEITIVERQPLLLWQSGEQRATIDRHGVIIGPQSAQDTTSYPLVEDQTKLPIPIDAAIVAPDVVNSFTTLKTLADGIGLSIDRMILPIPRCVIATPDTNTNANTNEREIIVNETNNSNNSSNSNGNTNSVTNSRVPMTIGTCQDEPARFNASDIWLQVSKGPVIYFDRHQDLTQAIDAVRRAFEDTQNRSARYIDARFPGRLYIQ